MKMLILVRKGLGVLMLFLSACTTFDHTVLRCTINTVDAECYCHKYRISDEYIGRSSETEIFPIEYCDKLIGVPPKDWAVLYELAERYRRMECSILDY